MITDFEEFHIPERRKERTIAKVNIFEQLVSHIFQQETVAYAKHRSITIQIGGDLDILKGE